MAEWGLAKACFAQQGVLQDYTLIAQWVRNAAEQGDAQAQYGLGALYASGQGVPQDYTLSAQWIRRAAEQGDAQAQYALGVLHAEGRGVPQDFEKAGHWYHKAAEQGLAEAQSGLAGLEQSLAEAALWYRKAAEQGDAPAQFQLAHAYDLGRGVPQDFEKAVYWYRKAAEQGHAKARRQLLFVPKSYLITKPWASLPPADDDMQGSVNCVGYCFDAILASVAERDRRIARVFAFDAGGSPMRAIVERRNGFDDTGTAIRFACFERSVDRSRTPHFEDCARVKVYNSDSTAPLLLAHR